MKHTVLISHQNNYDTLKSILGRVFFEFYIFKVLISKIVDQNLAEYRVPLLHLARLYFKYLEVRTIVKNTIFMV